MSAATADTDIIIDQPRRRSAAKIRRLILMLIG